MNKTQAFANMTDPEGFKAEFKEKMDAALDLTR
jgi:hypothetical protein